MPADAVGNAMPAQAGGADAVAGVLRDRAAWIILAAALVLHAVLMPAPGYERDLYWFGTWMRTALEHGVSHVSEKVWCDYPPGYLYLLQAVGFTWKALTAAAVPADGSVALIFLVKVVPVLADLAGACVLFAIARPRLGRKPALAALAAYAFNPALVFNSAVWGQADSVTALLALLAVWSACRRRSAWAFGLVAAATLVKFQAVVLVPVLAVGVLMREGRAGAWRAYKGGAIVSLALLLPFFWSHRVESVMTAATGAVGRYPHVSMNAHNVWWLAFGTASPETSDALRVGNASLSLHDLGLLMLAVATVLILWRLASDLRRDSRSVAPALFRAAALELMAFYLFPTQMHERYVVPAVAALAALALFESWTWWAYGSVSLAMAVSLASTLRATYPGGLGALGRFLPEGRPETYVVSVVFLAVFAVLLLRGAGRRYLALAPALVVAATVATVAVVLTPRKATQRLSDWEPVEERQAWGQRHRDRSVDGNRLAVSGFMFRHGIGTHAESVLKYHLNGAFREFDTLYMVDDEAARGQMAQFRIVVDGEVRHDSGIVRVNGWPWHARVNVAGAKFLTLEVLDGGDGINNDHAEWLEPVLLR